MADEHDEMAELRRHVEELQRTAAANAATARAEAQARAALQAQLDTIPRNAQQYMNPELRIPESAIVLPTINTRNFEIKSHFITLIKASAFEGKPTECPIRHMKVFLDLCDTIANEQVPQEYIQLKAFKWSVTGRAQQWLESLPPRSMMSEFLA